MTVQPRFDILVAGNGPVGKVAALSFARAGFTVAIAAPVPALVDQRTTALMVPSVRMLESLGVWEFIAPNAAPLRSMRIVDATKNLVRARTVTFNASEIDEDAFGWNVPNSALNAALDQKINKTVSISVFHAAVVSYDIAIDDVKSVLADGSKISTQLIAGADGRTSAAREAAGISVKSWSYPQIAFVTTFEHRLPHEDMSTEFHTEAGPCVQVPLPGNRSSLVWVVTPSRAEALKAMNSEQLSWAIEQQLFSILGKVFVGEQRQFYPLAGQYPDKFAQNRIALLGEAAHVFPPIGAQGLNLGMRDVEDLCAAALSNPVDPGAQSVLELFNRNRRPDILARVSAVHTLNKSLLSTLLPAQFARAFGLAMLDSAPPLRSLFMREGMRPGAGFNSLLGALNKSLGEKRT
jgi:2-octaprenyl-6-methoxyphenol hydroxylase